MPATVVAIAVVGPARRRPTRRARPRCRRAGASPGRPPVAGCAAEDAGRHRRRDDRRDVADGVAPAAVHLDRGHDDVRGCGRRRPGAAGDERRSRARRAGRLHRRDRRRRAALVADPDHEAARRRARARARTPGPTRVPSRQARPPPRVAEDRRHGHRRVLGRPAARHDDRPAAVAPPRRTAAASAAAEPSPATRSRDPCGERGLGRDHLGHRPRRRRPASPASAWTPRGPGRRAAGRRGRSRRARRGGRPCPDRTRRPSAPTGSSRSPAVPARPDGRPTRGHSPPGRRLSRWPGVSSRPLPAVSARLADVCQGDPAS